jgi:type II secretion system protein D
MAALAMLPPAYGDPAPASKRVTTQPAANGAINQKRPTTQLSLSFKDAPLDSVLDYLSETAGFVIVKDTPIEGRVTLVSRQPVSADEAVLLLNTVLKSNGYTALQQGRVIKIIARDKAKKLSIPVHFGSDPDSVDATDEIITQVIPVINFDAIKLKADLAPMISTDADITANGGANAIVITDTTANIKRVMEIISALDRHESSNFELKHYVLKNASAVNATRLITAIFKPEDPRPGQKKEQPTVEQALRGRINAVADERTNTIYITAPAETLAVVEGILKELDSNPASVSAIRIFPLKYADATGAVKMLTAIFKPDDLKPKNPEAPKPATDLGLSGHVNAAADERTNSVIVAAPTETLIAIEDIFKRIDADPSSNTELKVIPLVNADSVTTAKMIMSVFKPEDNKPQTPQYYQERRANPVEPGPNARVNAVADERTNSVVLTAPTETFRVITEIIKTLDANPAATSNIKVVQLKNADASAAVKLLSTIFKTDEPNNTTQNQNIGVKMVGVTEQASKIKITTAADDRTNTLVISAPNEAMTVIEGIVKQLDANPVSDEAIFIYRLKNGQAANLEPVLNAVFGNTSSSNGQRQNRGQSGSNPIRGQLPTQTAFGGSLSNRGNRGLSSNNAFANSNAINSSGLLSQNNSNVNSISSGLPPGLARLANELMGMVSIVAEPDTNSLLVTTVSKYQDKVRKIIEELDRPVPQVLIKVLIAEVTHDKSDDLGIDFSVLNQRANKFGERVGTGFGTAASTGGLVVNFVESNVNVTLRALATAGKLDVLSRPYILASDNQLASITVGQEVPFITDTRTTDLGQTLNTIQYQDIGIILNVTPHINVDGLVILDVAPEISQLTGTTIPISGQVSAPVFAKRSAQSRVGIKDGQTIVIGGLMEDRKTSTLEKVPLLGDIPLIGPLFQRNQVTKSKTELLIFLTPHVAQQPEALKPMSQDELRGTLLTPGAVSPGVFDDHIRGLQRGGPGIPAAMPDSSGFRTLLPASQPTTNISP